MERTTKLSAEAFRKQAEFRYHLRKFNRSSELNAKAAGLEPNQYQLILALKGLPSELEPNISTVAERLLIEQHSAVELIDRSVKKGVVERFREGSDRRKVFLRLTELGEKLVNEVAIKNRQELLTALPVFLEFMQSL